MSQKEKKNCFIIAPIGEEGSKERQRSDQILKYVITPALEKCDYKAIRADKISDPGIITSQIIEHLIDDSLVIADLTGQNPNVFYELAIRHFTNKPFIQIIESEESIPFDIVGLRTIGFDYRDLGSVDKCKTEIINQIHSIEEKPDQVETPVSFAVNQKYLRQSGNPLEKGMGEIISMLQEIRNDMENGYEDLSDDLNNLRRGLTGKPTFTRTRKNR